MKRKLGLIQAFQSDLTLLIFEPTERLDSLMQEPFYKLLVDVKQRGRTVLTWFLPLGNLSASLSGDSINFRL